MIDERRRKFAELSAVIFDRDQGVQQILAGILTAIGISRVRKSIDIARGIDTILETASQIVFVRFDGTKEAGNLTRLIRRSNTAFDPNIPIIAYQMQPSATDIVEARDAGVSEFFAVPASTRAVEARVVAAVDRPRELIRSYAYVGPDRRRATKPFDGTERRSADPPPA